MFGTPLACWGPHLHWHASGSYFCCWKVCNFLNSSGAGDNVDETVFSKEKVLAQAVSFSFSSSLATLVALHHHSSLFSVSSCFRQDGTMPWVIIIIIIIIVIIIISILLVLLFLSRWYRALNALKAMHTMQKLTFPETVPGEQKHYHQDQDQDQD